MAAGMCINSRFISLCSLLSDAVCGRSTPLDLSCSTEALGSFSLPPTESIWDHLGFRDVFCCNHISPFLSPHRYFTNISIGGRDYSFNSDGYLSKPLLDVISYINGRGWEEVSAQLCMLMLITKARWRDHLTPHQTCWLTLFLSHVCSSPP